VSYKFHEVAECFPRPTEDEFNDLVKSIKANGQLVPIELYDGLIIDGISRQEACLEAGVEPEYVDLTDSLKESELIEYVTALNADRRHLTVGQKAMAAARLSETETFKKAATQRMQAGGKSSSKSAIKPEGNEDSGVSPVGAPLPGRRTAQAAKVVGGASDRSTQRATKVLHKASDEVLAAVDSGRISLAKAEQIVKKPRKQQAAMLNGKPKPKKTVEETDKYVRLGEIHKKAVLAINEILRDFKERNEGEDAKYIGTAYNSLKIDLNEVKGRIRVITPVEDCRKCKGKGCATCGDLGFWDYGTRRQRDA